jgi:hypothetical protein
VVELHAETWGDDERHCSRRRVFAAAASVRLPRTALELNGGKHLEGHRGVSSGTTQATIHSPGFSATMIASAEERGATIRNAAESMNGG